MPQRRALLAALALAPLAAGAQGAPRRLGVLHPGPPRDGPGSPLDRFRQGLRELGLVEGREIRLEVRYDGMQPDRIPVQVAELLDHGVDLLVAGSTGAALAAQRATRTIPVVMAVSGDPVADGLVASLARPGGNITGMSIMSPELGARRLQLLGELLPRLQQVALLVDTVTSRAAAEAGEYEAAARPLGLRLVPLRVSAPADYAAAFQAARRADAQAMVLVQSVQFAIHRSDLAALALAHQMPTLSGSGDGSFTRAGGLMNYGASIAGSWHRAASFVRRILDGARPAELQQPTRFELAINLRTAQAIGLAVPQQLILLADEVVR